MSCLIHLLLHSALSCHKANSRSERQYQAKRLLGGITHLTVWLKDPSTQQRVHQTGKRVSILLKNSLRKSITLLLHQSLIGFRVFCHSIFTSGLVKLSFLEYVQVLHLSVSHQLLSFCSSVLQWSLSQSSLKCYSHSWCSAQWQLLFLLSFKLSLTSNASLRTWVYQDSIHALQSASLDYPPFLLYPSSWLSLSPYAKEGFQS